MKAAQLTSYDGPTALVTNDVDKPTIQPDQVLVKVKAAAINPFDIKVAEGAARSWNDMSLPATLGGDLAGIVAEIGADVSGFEVGQEVFGQANALSGQGSFAEFAPAKSSSLAIKPNNIDFVTAAAYPLATVSAYDSVVDKAKLQAGQKILIHGGAGGIGSQAIQIAKNLDAHIVTTASGEDAEYVKSLGADEVIDYTTQKFTELVRDCDVVFDTVGGETNTLSYQVLKPGGTLVSMLAAPNEELMKKYQVTALQQQIRVTTQALDHIRELIESGKLTTHIDKIFPLDQASNAMMYQAAGRIRGKVVLQID